MEAVAESTIVELIVTNRMDEELSKLVSNTDKANPMPFIMTPDQDRAGVEVVVGDDIIGGVESLVVTPQEIRMQVEIIYHHRFAEQYIMEVRMVAGHACLVQTETLKRTI